jgi:hypothetical protein
MLVHEPHLQQSQAHLQLALIGRHDIRASLLPHRFSHKDV